MVGDLLRSPASSVCAKMKHAGKTCGHLWANRQSLKLFLVITRDLREFEALQMVSELTRDRELCQWTRDPWAIT